MVFARGSYPPRIFSLDALDQPSFVKTSLPLIATPPVPDPNILGARDPTWLRAGSGSGGTPFTRANRYNRHSGYGVVNASMEASITCFGNMGQSGASQRR